MNRTQLLELEAQRAARATAPLELRDASAEVGFPAFVLEGYASITEAGYEMYGGPPYGWTEIVARGAFGKTLSEKPKVDLLVNHGGMPLASTQALRYTVVLNEDTTGLAQRSLMNPDESDAQLLASKITDRRMTQMSFAFRVMRQRWEELDGTEGDAATAPVRRILEVSLHQGDISMVNNGANPATWATLRDLDAAMCELRAGRPISAEQRTVVQQWLTFTQVIDDEADGEAPVVGDQQQNGARALDPNAAANLRALLAS